MSCAIPERCASINSIILPNILAKHILHKNCTKMGSAALQFSLKNHCFFNLYTLQLNNSAAYTTVEHNCWDPGAGQMVITLAPEIIVMGLFFTSRGCWYSMALVPGGLRGNLVQVLVQKFTLFHQLELQVFHGTDGLHRWFGAKMCDTATTTHYSTCQRCRWLSAKMRHTT